MDHINAGAHWLTERPFILVPIQLILGILLAHGIGKLMNLTKR
jgi:hypothetical protein